MNLCFCVVNSQRLFCSKKLISNVGVKLSVIQKCLLFRCLYFGGSVGVLVLGRIFLGFPIVSQVSIINNNNDRFTVDTNVEPHQET